MMKGTMYLKSRYLTLRAVNQMPAPKARMRAANMNRGRNAQCHDGILPKQIDATTYRKRTTRKSTVATPIEESGMMSRGKYTLEIRLAFETRLALEPESAAAKNCQGSWPAATRRG